VVRKLARGRLPIDGRIDLHGLTQSEAHNLLFDFIARAHERGLRHVLVITGKGSSRGSQGVLKRLVPEWLAKPEFRFLISGHEDAARSHGGEGALYIRLRRERGGAR
jgi:DNA-nicking Smr family endonuclease